MIFPARVVGGFGTGINAKIAIESAFVGGSIAPSVVNVARARKLSANKPILPASIANVGERCHRLGAPRNRSYYLGMRPPTMPFFVAQKRCTLITRFEFLHKLYDSSITPPTSVLYLLYTPSRCLHPPPCQRYSGLLPPSVSGRGAGVVLALNDGWVPVQKAPKAFVQQP